MHLNEFMGVKKGDALRYGNAGATLRVVKVTGIASDKPEDRRIWVVLRDARPLPWTEGTHAEHFPREAKFMYYDLASMEALQVVAIA